MIRTDSPISCNIDLCPAIKTVNGHIYIDPYTRRISDHGVHVLNLLSVRNIFVKPIKAYELA